MDNTTEDANPKRWFVRRGGTIKGPMTSAKVRHHIVEERLLLTDDVSTDKQNWQSIANTPEVVPLSMRKTNEENEQLHSAIKKNERKKSWITIVVLIVLIAGTVFMVAEPPKDNTAAKIDCSLPAAPKVNWYACPMRNRQLPGVDLSGAKLESIKMANANLTESKLIQANLRYANLSTASLAYANLQQADLTGANLAGSDLTNANLQNADLSHADLSSARLGGTILDGAKLNGTIWVDGQLCSENSVSSCNK